MLILGKNNVNNYVFPNNRVRNYMLWKTLEKNS